QDLCHGSECLLGVGDRRRDEERQRDTSRVLLRVLLQLRLLLVPVLLLLARSWVSGLATTSVRDELARGDSRRSPCDRRKFCDVGRSGGGAARAARRRARLRQSAGRELVR